MSPTAKFPNVRAGMTVAVDQKIKEETPKGDIRERIQTFEGLVIARAGSGTSETITVRKVSNGVGVEKIFPLNMPSIADIQVTKEGHVRRARLTFTRNVKARGLKEKHVAKVAAKK